MTTRAFYLLVAGSMLALSGVAGSSSALASCGDWLAHAEGAAAASAAERIKSEPTGAASSGSAARPVEFTGRVPCRGPYCRQAPSHPATPPVPAVYPAAPEWALLGGSAALRTYTLPDSIAVNFDARPAKGFPWRIDHPPRAWRNLGVAACAVA